MSPSQELCDLLGLPQPDTSTATFVDWPTASKMGYATKTTFKFDAGLVPVRGETSRASYQHRRVFTRDEWRDERQAQAERRTSLADWPEKLERKTAFHQSLVPVPTADGRVSIVLDSIPLFHRSQMMPGKFRGRTRAFINYGNICWRNSDSGNYIARNFSPDIKAKWFTRDRSRRASVLEPFVFFSEGLLRAHVNHREVYGVKAKEGRKQWWAAIDLDAHLDKGDDREVFLRQAEALLAHVQGKEWRVCIGENVVTGFHLLKIFDEPRSLDEIHNGLRTLLHEVATLNPGLDTDAVAKSMKPFEKLEIFPDPNRGFRLPLGRGYTALLDRPLDTVHHHTMNGTKLFGADIESFMNWDGTEMSLADKLDYIRQRLPEDRADEVRKVKQAAKRSKVVEQREEQPVVRAMNDKQVLGPLKGRYRPVLVDFYSGRLQRPKSLQVGILLGVNALWAENYPVDQRTDYLLDLLQSIEVTNPDFSSRLNNGNWESIEDDIEHVVQVAERRRSRSDMSQADRRSCEGLRRWAAAMQAIGFRFSDRSTWDRASSPKLDVVLTPEDEAVIAETVVPVFGLDLPSTIAAVREIVAIVACKVRNGDGISREYRRAVLVDHGVQCQHNSKLARCWDVLVTTNFLTVAQDERFHPDRHDGRARVYGIGQRLANRLFGIDPVEIPTWMVEELSPSGTTTETGTEQVEPSSSAEALTDELHGWSYPPNPSLIYSLLGACRNKRVDS